MYYIEYCQGKGLFFLNILPISLFNKERNSNINFNNLHFGSDYNYYRSTRAVVPSADTFIKRNEEQPNGYYRIQRRIKNPASSKFTLDDYRRLSKSEKAFMMANIPDETKNLAAVNVEIGFAIKQKLDDTYGSNNYKFISLGTSPACIGKVLELLGADVAYLPMSYAHTTCTKYWLKNSPYLDFYKDYMNKIGLSNEKLKEKNQRGIICDYTITGRSLQLSEFMLKGPLGLDENLLDTYTINSLIENSNHIPDEVKEKYLNELLKKEKAADFCDVPHFSFIDKRPFNSGKIRDSKSLISYFENYRAKSSNAYNFCVMKILEDRGKLREIYS